MFDAAAYELIELNSAVALCRLGDTARLEEIDMIYKIALHKSDEGVAVSVPGLPGCWSQGKNEEEAIAKIREAISDYLSVVDMQLEGAEIREIQIDDATAHA